MSPAQLCITLPTKNSLTQLFASFRLSILTAISTWRHVQTNSSLLSTMSPQLQPFTTIHPVKLAWRLMNNYAHKNPKSEFVKTLHAYTTVCTAMRETEPVLMQHLADQGFPQLERLALCEALSYMHPNWRQDAIFMATTKYERCLSKSYQREYTYRGVKYKK